MLILWPLVAVLIQWVCVLPLGWVIRENLSNFHMWPLSVLWTASHGVHSVLMCSWAAPLTGPSSCGSRTNLTPCWASPLTRELCTTSSGFRSGPHYLEPLMRDSWRSGTWIQTCESDWGDVSGIVLCLTQFHSVCVSGVKAKSVSTIYTSLLQLGPSHCAACCPWCEDEVPAVCHTHRLRPGRRQWWTSDCLPAQEPQCGREQPGRTEGQVAFMQSLLLA